MMKGYLTVFLSLSLSALIGFVLLLTGNAVRNAEKVRLEGIADIGMNSALAEFDIELHKRYGLLYIDASYLGKQPALSNLEDRLKFYVNSNIGEASENKPWGFLALKEIKVTEIKTAAEGNGNSMKYQAVRYVQDCGIQRKEADVPDYLDGIKKLDNSNPRQEWISLQEQIAGIELPRIQNEKGEWEEVPLGNPADRIFGFLGSDVLYLLDVNMDGIGTGCIKKESCISNRNIVNDSGIPGKEADDKMFICYLFDKMGNYREVKENSFMKYQLEYIAHGQLSDYENLKAATEKMLDWRFAAAVNCAFSDGGLYGEASEAAEELTAVQLKPEFHRPVTESILYACAYLEAIGDVKCLLAGGSIEVEKEKLSIGVNQVLEGNIPQALSSEESGLEYGQYLACMLFLLDENVRNLRSMDIMEMDIRYLTGNPVFSMDWCVERYTARLTAYGGWNHEYVICRTYGYY